jgi:hypothetical protein
LLWICEFIRVDRLEPRASIHVRRRRFGRLPPALHLIHLHRGACRLVKTEGVTLPGQRLLSPGCRRCLWRGRGELFLGLEFSGCVRECTFQSRVSGLRWARSTVVDGEGDVRELLIHVLRTSPLYFSTLIDGFVFLWGISGY